MIIWINPSSCFCLVHRYTRAKSFKRSQNTKTLRARFPKFGKKPVSNTGFPLSLSLSPKSSFYNFNSINNHDNEGLGGGNSYIDKGNKYPNSQNHKRWDDQCLDKASNQSLYRVRWIERFDFWATLASEFG